MNKVVSSNIRKFYFRFTVFFEKAWVIQNQIKRDCFSIITDQIASQMVIVIFHLYLSTNLLFIILRRE
jgi:hypothetical protein